MRLRQGVIDHPPDLVVYPKSEADVVKLVDFCAKRKIPVTPFAGRSSVTFGVEPVKGGISLDLTRHINKVLEIARPVS
jgi:alkyldihydroxyacetonephosphate synthase